MSCENGDYVSVCPIAANSYYCILQINLTLPLSLVVVLYP